MDYKTRHPGQIVWSEHPFLELRQPVPYDQLSGGMLFELDAPDASTQFLLAVAGFDEDNGLMLYYGIEAAKGCPMREAFEWSELSWPDFWMHKGWVLRIVQPFQGGDAVGNYILPSEIDAKTMGRFGRLSGPYESKRYQMEWATEHYKPGTAMFRKAEREYREFMARFGVRLLRSAG